MKWFKWITGVNSERRPHVPDFFNRLEVRDELDVAGGQQPFRAVEGSEPGVREKLMIAEMSGEKGQDPERIRS